jgi:hypothetical protein
MEVTGQLDDVNYWQEISEGTSLSQSLYSMSYHASENYRCIEPLGTMPQSQQ